MARRSDHSREELYDMAIEAAERIVETEGSEGLTARRVAGEIGYTPGTLYNIFNDLDDLTLHLNGRTLDRLLSRLGTVAISGAPEEDLNSLISIYVDFLTEHPNLWNFLFDHRLPAGAVTPEIHAKKVDQLFGIAETALAPLFAGQPDELLHQNTRMLWASIHGFCALAANGKLNLVGDSSITDLASRITAVYIKGLQTELGSP